MSEVAKRKTYYSKLCNAVKVVDDHPNKPISYHLAQEMLIRAQEVFRDFCVVQDRLIETAADDAALSLQYNEGMKVEDIFSELRSKLRPLIESLQPASKVATTSAVPSIKLPSVELPSFTGDLAEWTSFKDLFTAAVGGNATLSGAQKLQYLKTALQGEAASLIKSLFITDTNYASAWKLLLDRYDNQREIVFALVKKLFVLKTLREENATELQTLVDTFVETVQALAALKRPTDKWDDLLVVLISMKLDSATRREWAIKQTSTDIPTYQELITFLRSHIRGLKSSEENRKVDRSNNRPVKVHTATTGSSVKCLMCKGNHAHAQCHELRQKHVNERIDLVKTLKLCFNCLGSHLLRNCSTKGTCRKCGKRHHTLLHREYKPVPAASTATQGSSDGSGEQQSSSGTVSSHHIRADPEEVLMTAVVNLRNRHGDFQPFRLMVDSGSGPDLITEETISSLGLKRNHTRNSVIGIGGAYAGRSRGTIEATVSSRFNDKQTITAKFHIMNKITGFVPSSIVRGKGWKHLEGLQLADPNWENPGKIDMLLGIKHLHKILLFDRRVSNEVTAPVAWESIFGWLVAGECPEKREGVITSYHVTTDQTLEVIQRFWELEDIPSSKQLSQEEVACEKHFTETHRRLEDGRFQVAIPFNNRKLELGETRSAAVQRFQQIERRMQRNPEFRAKYVEFMREYQRLGHMVEVQPPPLDSSPPLRVAYLPHHGVINESSSSTKLRIVYDGSCPSSSGVSLNETMMVGATVQDDLYNILLRFRMKRVVLKGDIVKMFRQFGINEDDSNYHRIVWRESPTEPLKDFRLTTVTYGTACAPFLATRCIQQLASDVAEEHPEASRALLKSTYVDDILDSVDSKDEAIQLFHELTEACSTAGLELRKWASNLDAVLEVIPEDRRECEPYSFDENNTIKTLGVQWFPQGDIFKFKEIEFKYEKQLTKRKLCSNAARVFDPLGLISCFSVRAKILLQELWKSSCGWDDVVPESVEAQWNEYRQDLQVLTRLSIPRHIVAIPFRYEIHGFSDSSERALGVILYIRNFNEDGSITVSFVTSKTKVAPVKLVSLPRLELEAALMLAKLVNRVKMCLCLEGRTYLWTDSTITLKWIQGSPHRWKTFVGNRVSKIQSLTDTEVWHHVPGTDNPADWGSRGAYASQLINNEFWWKGPKWLSEPGLPAFSEDSIPEQVDMEERAIVVHVSNRDYCMDLLQRFSSLSKLKRVTAYIFRFIRWRKWQSRSQSRETVRQWSSGQQQSMELTAEELDQALEWWVCRVQEHHYKEEIRCLEKENRVKSNSHLKALHPYLDNVGVLRISGRLEKANLPEHRRHQIILPHSSHLTTLLVEDFHLRLLHGGFSVTWARLQSEFWIIRGRDKVRHLIRKCVTCRRYRAAAASQLMGSLPNPRITPARPFLHSGVDYAGPFTLKNPVGRGAKTYKAYMCLFVCLSTKAIHLEAVSSLSTDAFLEAFRRFVSRRGICSSVHSDCGTNFVGADRELRQLIRSRDADSAIAGELASRGIDWHFNPPAAPHHGGLWEAGVKSAKHHLRRVVGNSILSYEQFNTILCQVEAVLNSRPLYAMSNDPTDYEALTPGHFLIGEPLTAVPVSNIEDIPSNRLNQFQLLQQRVQHFWRRWSAEYLNTLQQRNKWRWERDNVKVGDLVLIAEDTSPGLWKMGRVAEVHPSSDKLVRVVSVKTVSGQVKRPITKLVPLVNSDSESFE